MERGELSRKSLDELSDWKAMISAGSQNDQVANAEFMRRQTVLQQQAADAAIREAAAAEQTAEYTRNNARYLLWSVIVLAASSIGTLIVSLLKH